MSVTSCSCMWPYTRFDTVNETYDYGVLNLTASVNGQSNSAITTSTRYDYYQRGGIGIKVQFTGSNDNGFVCLFEGGYVGAVFVPSTAVSGDYVDGSC